MRNQHTSLTHQAGLSWAGLLIALVAIAGFVVYLLWLQGANLPGQDQTIIPQAPSTKSQAKPEAKTEKTDEKFDYKFFEELPKRNLGGAPDATQYVVLVTSVSDRARAEGIRAELALQGYDTPPLREIKRVNGTLYQISLGPMNEDAARKAMDAMRAQGHKPLPKKLP
ncbi:MAG: SPOR domain-containing protein [Gammaproteobacteria bacterium]|jgi:cell division protein FtsN